MRESIGVVGFFGAFFLSGALASSPLVAQSNCPEFISAGGSTGRLIGSRIVEQERQRAWYHPDIGYFYWTETTETTMGTYVLSKGGSVDIQCTDELI